MKAETHISELENPDPGGMTLRKTNRSVLLGAAFLMATSAIGPGFLTQTTYFTETLGANFGFVILISILIDIGAQINIWRIIAVSERRTQDIANMVVPGLGFFLAVLVVIGGLVFNIGNIAGAGLGMNVMFEMSPELGAGISGVIAIGIFLIREAGKVMDKFAQIMGTVMIALTLYVMFTASPPYGEAAVKSIVPDSIDILAIVTLVGGTVGGYITFAGGHRLLDGGIKGVGALSEVTKGAVSAMNRFHHAHPAFLGCIGSGGQRIIPGSEEPGRFGLSTGSREYGLQNVRRHFVGGFHHVRCRIGLHVRIIYSYLWFSAGEVSQGDDCRFYRGFHACLRDGGQTGERIDSRRSAQWVDPSHCTRSNVGCGPS